MNSDMERLNNLDIPKIGGKQGHHRGHPGIPDQDRHRQSMPHQPQRSEEKAVRMPESSRIPPTQPQVSRNFNEVPSREVSASQPQKIPQESPCLLYTSPSPRDLSTSRMPSSA